MERLQQTDRNLSRAARRLYRNRQLQPQVEARIAWAEETLSAGLALHGAAMLTVGAFHVEQGEAGIRVTKTAGIGAEQLELPDPKESDELTPRRTLETLVNWASGDDGLPRELLDDLDKLRTMITAAEGGGSV